jgi:hypothetical protein
MCFLSLITYLLAGSPARSAEKKVICYVTGNQERGKKGKRKRKNK